MNEEDKRQKLNISINEKLNELLEKEMKEKGVKKSQIIEKAIKNYIESLDENNLNEEDLEKLINTFVLKNKE
jgi:metal-responsive CopG/Arc/MetJ family transcriptional regulator